VSLKDEPAPGGLEMAKKSLKKAKKLESAKALRK
jgi:hypothetical protein